MAITNMPVTKSVAFNASASLAIVVPSIVSAIAVLFILSHIATAAGAQVYRRMVRGEKTERIFVATPLGIYIVSLLFSSLLSAIGASMNIHWVKVNQLEPGMVCSAQATLLQAGFLSTSFFIFYVSCHTLNAVVLRKRIVRWILVISVVALWALVLFLGPLLTSRTSLPFYGKAGSWCWITASRSQMSLQGIPVAIVSGLSTMIFAIIFVRARSAKSQVAPSKGTKSAAILSDNGKLIVAKYLVWYPVVYTIFTLPLAIVAFLGKGSAVTNGVVFAEVLYSFQGLAFVAIFVCTYRVFGGRRWHFGVGSYTLQGTAGKASGESFEALEKALSPVSPKQQPWKPATKEWNAPLDRTFSTRTRPLSMVSTVSAQSKGNASSVAPPLPEKPLPIARTLAHVPSHRRVQSDDTIVERVDGFSPESARNRNLQAISEAPTTPASAMRTPRTPSRMPLGSMHPGEFDRMRSMTKTPPSALSKKSSQSGARLPRKESVRFAPTPTVFGDSSVEVTTPAIPSPLPSRPAVAVTIDSTLRSPTRKPVRMTDSIIELASAYDEPPLRKTQPPQPTIIIPGRAERNERDTIFVMETPIQLRPLTEYEIPAQVIEVLKSRPQSMVDTPSSENGSSILDYYGATSPGVSPINGNELAPRVNIVPGSDEGHSDNAPARLPPAGLLSVPATMSRKLSSQSRPGYV